MKTTVRYTYATIKMAKIKNSYNTKHWRGCRDHLHIAGENFKWYSYFGK